MLVFEPRVVTKFWAISPISCRHVSFWVSVLQSKVAKYGPSTLHCGYHEKSYSESGITGDSGSKSTRLVDIMLARDRGKRGCVQTTYFLLQRIAAAGHEGWRHSHDAVRSYGVCLHLLLVCGLVQACYTRLLQLTYTHIHTHTQSAARHMVHRASFERRLHLSVETLAGQVVERGFGFGWVSALVLCWLMWPPL